MVRFTACRSRSRTSSRCRGGAPGRRLREPLSGIGPGAVRQSSGACATPAPLSSASRTCTSSALAPPVTSPCYGPWATRGIRALRAAALRVARAPPSRRRMVAGAVGTDGGGSIRIPSAYCGATGLKFTWGQIPVDGFTHGYLTYGTAGPICRDAADARLLAEALLARPLEAGSASGLRIGIPQAQWNDLDPEVERACQGRSSCCAAAASGPARSRSPAWSTRDRHRPAASGWNRFPSSKPELVAEITPHLSPLVRR